MGRPKGSKNKPKWLKELEAARPRRPRGRPPGSKAKPKNLSDFVAESLNARHEKPNVEKPNKKPLGRALAEWNKRPLEERSAHARKAIKRRWEIHPVNSKIGIPHGWSIKQFRVAQEEAKRDARRIYRIMADKGMVPEDEGAQEALLTALQLMREPATREFKLKAARTVLEYTKAKPTAKHEHTIKTAEDFLDDLAADEDGNEPDKS